MIDIANYPVTVTCRRTALYETGSSPQFDRYSDLSCMAFQATRGKSALCGRALGAYFRRRRSGRGDKRNKVLAARSFSGGVCYDVYIMMARTQITLEAEMQRRARQRASELGVSLAEYFRRLVARDLTRPRATIEVDRIFDLGNSGSSDIAKNKDAMITESLQALNRRGRRR